MILSSGKVACVSMLKKPLSGCLGQVYFPAGQAIFLAHLPTGQSPRQDTSQCNLKGKAGFQIFL